MFYFSLSFYLCLQVISKMEKMIEGLCLVPTFVTRIKRLMRYIVEERDSTISNNMHFPSTVDLLFKCAKAKMHFKNTL